MKSYNKIRQPELTMFGMSAHGHDNAGLPSIGLFGKLWFPFRWLFWKIPPMSHRSLCRRHWCGQPIWIHSRYCMDCTEKIGVRMKLVLGWNRESEEAYKKA